jgi:hypothetical protein
MRLALVIAALFLQACIDFQEAEDHYCATHTGCPDGGLATDAGP